MSLYVSLVTDPDEPLRARFGPVWDHLERAGLLDEFRRRLGDPTWEDEDSQVLFEDCLTHNLSSMAEAAGIHRHLWRPDEIGITRAEQLVEPLYAGWARLLSDPERFRAFDPPNGWGTYQGLLGFVVRYLRACQAFPQARVRISR